MKPWLLFLLVFLGAAGLVFCGTTYWGWPQALLRAFPGIGIAAVTIFVAWSNNRIGSWQMKNLVWLSAGICAGVIAVVALNSFR